MEDENIIKKCDFISEKIPSFAVIKGDNIFYKSNLFLINQDEVTQIRELYASFNKGQLISINNVAFSVDENDVDNNYFNGKNDFDDIIHIKASSCSNKQFILLVIVKSDSTLKQKEIYELAHSLFEVTE